MEYYIIMYVEYKESNSSYWRSFINHLVPSINSRIFEKLGGITLYGGEPKVTPVAADRGFPSDSIGAAFSDNYLAVSRTGVSGSGICSIEEAEEWVKENKSHYLKESGKNLVSHPGYYSHSWCTTDEYEQVIKDPDIQISKMPEYTVVLDTLRSFEKQGCRTRIIFWFG